MTQETIRVYDLSNELKLSTKEVIELLDKKLQIKVKSHSSTLTQEQVKRFKEALQAPEQKVTVKPKAFIVKKAKQAPKEEALPEEAKKEEPIAEQQPTISIKPRLGPRIIQRAEDRFKPIKKPDIAPKIRQEADNAKKEGSAEKA